LSDALTLSNGTFATGGNSFTMLSTASKTARIATVAGTGAVSGNFTIQRYIASRTSITWANLSSPVTTTTFADWENELYFSYPHNGTSIWSNVLKYSESAADYVGVTAGTTILPGEGMEIYLSDDINLNSFGNTLLTSVGQPTTGNQLINLSYTAGPYAGQNLIGNPFASNIRINSMVFTNALTTIDVYDNVTGNYLSLSGTTELAPHQGFWAYATSAGASVSIPESAKTTTTTGTIRASEIENYLMLTISAADGSHTKAHTLKIAADTAAKDGWDLKDHPYRKSPCKEAPSITANSENFPLSISTIHSGNEEISLPLNTAVGINGNYQITVKGLNSIIDNYSCVLLEDKILGKIIDLNKQSNYLFSSSINDNNHRFVLHLSKSSNCKMSSTFSNSINNGEVYILPTLTGSSISFNLEKETKTQIQAVNTLGQIIMEPINVEVQKQIIDIQMPSDFHGIYLLKITTDNGEFVKKMYR